ncbi:dihydrofolate reductase [Entomoplasma freundtii]|uniref:dihydrofolate reductase n=1 Tax=Entomoplasma freundtii TaxID=74700 RepID=A0A2K8NRK6_9MOLU|nr:dihydrofolate reductase [Entomoplasma freundtii]ATZ16492.1 dihydrofolate reductase [Entomoplasma freundtii]TDY56021.1 dihydrofolate reductase [Entomoplasma freundtii]
MIKMIWAQTQEGVIGDKNRLPWRIPEEMAHFQNTTKNKTILMGRNTFESLGNKPLKNRFNYVLTSTLPPSVPEPLKNLQFIDNISAVVSLFAHSRNQDLYVIGGNQVFATFLPYADQVIRTTIFHPYQGSLKIVPLDLSEFQLARTIKKPEFKIEYLERINHHHGQR